MASSIEALMRLGANTKDGLARCMGMEDFYLRMVAKGLEDAHFESLGRNLAEGDMQASFEDAHALKGSIGNLSLTPLFEKVAQISDGLKAGKAMDYDSLYREVMALRKAFVDA